MQCYIFDIDGTLADLSHRLPHIEKTPKDWRSFFAACPDDAPIKHIIILAQDIQHSGAFLVFVSGRSDEVREQTADWLAKQGLRGMLYMRKEGDHRPDHQVKVELLAELRAAGHNPIMAFDDRNTVVKMWRELGIPCAQVADGDF